MHLLGLLIYIFLSIDSLIYIEGKKNFLAHNYKVAKMKFQELLAYHNSKFVPYALYYLGRMATTGDSACEYYTKILADYKDSNIADNALLHIAKYYYILGDYKMAKDLLKRLIFEYPRSELRKEAVRLLRLISRPKMFYGIQVGAFRSEQSAKNFSLVYKKQGLPAWIFHNGLYKVIIGRYSTPDEARHIKERYKLEGFLVKIREESE